MPLPTQGAGDPEVGLDSGLTHCDGGELLLDARRRQSESARTKRTLPAASSYCDGLIFEHRRDDSEPRPQRFVEWMVWLALGLTVMVAWVVAPFVLICVAVGFIMETLFGMRLQRSGDSDGTDLASLNFHGTPFA